MNVILLVTGTAIATFVPRVLPVLFLDRIQLSNKMKVFLQLIPYTALTALVFPAILELDDNVWIGLLGGICAIVLSWKNIPNILVVILTILFVFILYLL